MKHSNNIIIAICVFAIIALFSCKRSENEVLPSGVEVNFFSAADGVFCFPGTKPIFIDKMDTARLDAGQFSTRSFYGESFPSLSSLGPSGTVSILYTRQSSGRHHLFITNGKKYLLADTTVDLTPGVKHNFYVYDDPDSLLYHCRILHLAEDKMSATNNCRFRLLHFSSDLGQMNCYFIMADGSRRFPGSLPANLKYGGYSNFITLDESVVGTDGNAYLQFYAGTDTASVKATATIPYRKGRTYAIVVSGLTNTKYVQYKDPAKPGSTTTVQLNASISARVRTIN